MHSKGRMNVLSAGLIIKFHYIFLWIEGMTKRTLRKGSHGNDAKHGTTQPLDTTLRKTKKMYENHM